MNYYTRWFDVLPRWLRRAIARSSRTCTLWDFGPINMDIIVFRPCPRIGITGFQLLLNR